MKHYVVIEPPYDCESTAIVHGVFDDIVSAVAFANRCLTGDYVEMESSYQPAIDIEVWDGETRHEMYHANWRSDNQWYRLPDTQPYDRIWVDPTA